MKDKIRRIKELRKSRDKNITYSQYLSEQVNKSVSYSDYISEQLNKSISYYSDYISGKVNP